MRKPTVENKYNLKPADIRRAVVLDEERLHEKPFWRNNIIQAWCLTGGVGKGFYGEYVNDYWIGFYDKDAKAYAGKIRYYTCCYDGICSYNFKTFFNEKDIENDYDLQIQEALLTKINWLIDEKIIEIPKKTNNKKGE